MEKNTNSIYYRNYFKLYYTYLYLFNIGTFLQINKINLFEVIIIS